MRLSLDRLWLVIAIGLPVLVALVVPMPAVDLAYQVRAGDEILRTAAIPAADTWTFTVAGTPWTDQQWLAQVALAIGHRVGGWELLAVLRAVLVGLALGASIAASMARGAGPRMAAILALLVFALSAPALALRPQLFGIVIFAALLWLIATRREHPRRLWAAPLLVLVWANVHGSFVLAPLVLGYAWLDDVVRGRPWRHTLAVLVVALLATLVNPFGPGVWGYAAGIGANPAITEHVSEWQRTTPFTVPGALFYASAVATLLLMARGRSALRWPDWLWIAAMLAIGVWTVRGLAWVPFGAAYVVAAALPVVLASTERRPAPSRPRPSPVAAILALVFGLAIVAALPWWRPSDPLTGRKGLLTYAPSGLAQAVAAEVEPGARVFLPQTWASWFEWAAPAPAYYLDSRFELFPADVWADYGAIAAGGADAQAALDRWSVDALVVPVGTPPLDGWRELYEDGDGKLLVPADAEARTAVVPPAHPEGLGPSAMVAKQGRSER
jgi:hypothetical protein